MKIITEKISPEELIKLAEQSYYNIVKAVVDIEKKIMVIDGELHADEESLLLDEGSKQQNLWGINIHPKNPRNDWIEFDSIINIKPRQNNHSRGIEDPEIREEIFQIVNKLVE